MHKLTTLKSFIAMTLVAIAGCQSSQETNQDNTDWGSYGHDLSNQRYASLKQVNVDNVHQLKKAWQFNSGVKKTFQATPIVKDGVMYVSLPLNSVVALDAVTGQEKWRYTHDRKPDWKLCCGPSNRGVAVADGKVYMGTVDARLVALDANTGDKVWDIDVVNDAIQSEQQGALNANDPNSQKKVTGGTGVGINMAPVIYKGKVIIGITGVGYGLHIDSPTADAPLGAVIGLTGLFGRPGFLAAFDMQTGEKAWQFDTIPNEGWEGQFKTETDDGVTLNRNIAQEKASLPKYPDAAKFGGGSAWSTPAIDTKTGILYFGTGNPSPQMNDISRPGDNLYTVSLVALNAETGKLKWYYQQVPHDLWGYDLASPPVLFDYKKDNETIAAVGQASKTGWFYVHNRENGQLLIKSKAFVPQKNLFQAATTAGTVVYPGILGGANWSPVSVDEANQSAFVAAMHAPIKYTLHETTDSNGETMRYTASEPTDDPSCGLLSAVDLASGDIKWQVKTDQPLVGGTLSTAGGLVLTGEGNGHLNAYESTTGKLLWQAKSEFGVNAPPMTYSVNGKQYISVVSGGNFLFGFKQGDAILTYALD